MPVPDHQRASRDVTPIKLPKKPTPPPEIIRATGSGTLDVDQFAVVLARLLDL